MRAVAREETAGFSSQSTGDSLVEEGLRGSASSGDLIRWEMRREIHGKTENGREKIRG
jgi:hypothetical protein